MSPALTLSCQFLWDPWLVDRFGVVKKDSYANYWVSIEAPDQMFSTQI